MSYCTISEAWGEPFEGPSSPAYAEGGAPGEHDRRSSSKSRRRRRKGTASSSTASSMSPATSAHLEGFANPTYSSDSPWETPDPAHYDAPEIPGGSLVPSAHPDAHTRQFARDLPAGQMPHTVEVSLQGAPFATEPVENGPTVTAEVVGADSPLRQPTAGHETKEAPTATVLPAIHEELDWMRNHMTRLTDRIDALSCKLDDRSASVPVPTPASTGDTVLYVVTGAFALVMLDILFRAGHRAGSAGR